MDNKALKRYLSVNERMPWWYVLGLGGILLVSIWLNFFRLGQDGYGNLYYAAAIKSMSMSWHNFFFASFDPAGFVSVDKPPLSLWLQVGSAYVFGMSPWSTLFPQALAGVLSVVLLAYLVQHIYGPVTGLLAAATLAVTPISVITNRNLTMDSLLTLVILLAIWAAMRAVETGRFSLLLLSFFLIGLGFNIKMSEAFLVVPALLLFYWFSALTTKKERIWHLSLACLLLVVVSACWISLVDLTPAAQRPYVGSSSGDSEWQLALFYNGTSRILGRITLTALSHAKELTQLQNNAKSFAFSPSPGGPGLVRLFVAPLGSQIGWLLPLAFVGLVGIRWDKPSFWPLNKQQQGLAIWGVWFMTQFIFFSASSFTSTYYIMQMAPSAAALLAMGVVTTWQDSGSRRRLLLPLMFLGTALVQIFLLSAYVADWERWLLLGVVVSVIVSALLLKQDWRNKKVLITVALCTLYLAPIVWAAIPVVSDRMDVSPYAGPTLVSSVPDGFTQTNQEMQPDAPLLGYLLKHQGKNRFLAATISSDLAAPMILQTGKAVMAMGGYAGEDQILSLTQLKEDIRQGDVHYFVFPQTLQEAHLSPELTAYQANVQMIQELSGVANIDPLVNWVRTDCRLVPTIVWHPVSTKILLDVYDCA